MQSTRIVAAAGAAALLIAGHAHAQGSSAKEDQGTIKYRQSLMESIGGDMSAIANIMKYGLPYLPNTVTHAEGLASHAKLIGNAFERKVTAGPTDAKPVIWEKPSEFLEKAKKLQDETQKLVTATQSQDPAQIGPQLKATGKACGGCHEDFRKPKEESYKLTAKGDEE